jgi:hypothetical protein
MKTREDKRMVKHDFVIKIACFGYILKIINTFIFWYMVIPLVPRLVTPREGPKAL